MLDRPVVLGSRRGRRMCSMHAGASSGPPRNEFQQVETRAGGLRPHHTRILQVRPARTFLASPLSFLSISIALGLIVSARSAVIRCAGILTNRCMPHEWTMSRFVLFSIIQGECFAIFYNFSASTFLVQGPETS